MTPTVKTLSTQLADNGNLIGHYLWRALPHTSTLTHAANSRLRAIPTLRPRAAAHYPWATTARAFEYLARMTLAPMPLADLPATRGAALLIRDRGEAVTRVGVREFYTRLAEALQRHSPTTLPLSSATTDEFARFAYVLALFDEVARTTRYTLGPLAMPQPKSTAAEWLAIPTADQIADLGQLLPAFTDAFTLAHDTPVVLFPLHQRADHGYDEGRPILFDNRLLVICTSVQSRVTAPMVRYLAGSALLLDAAWPRSVGYYMARQRVLIEWNVGDFFRRLTGDPAVSLDGTRTTFWNLCKIAAGPLDRATKRRT